MGALKSGKFWAGVIIGIVGYVVYTNYVKGRMG
jgi:hypothetical protein